MNPCKNFAKKYPIILAVLTFAFMLGLLKLMGLLPDSPLGLGIREIIMAVAVFAVTFLFMGKEKVAFSMKGFGYGFRLLRGYYIVLIVLSVFCILSTVLTNVFEKTGSSFQLITFINVSIACLFVGIVEEFSFRGLIFGGLVQKLGNTKKGIILAAVISALAFGVLHVLGSVFAGEITTKGSVITAICKTLQCAVFGVVMALIYYKTKNLFVIAALHSLDDYIIFIAGSDKSGSTSYVASNNIAPYIVLYTLFTLILVPALVKCIKNLKAGEAIPFDEEFLPK